MEGISPFRGRVAYTLSDSCLLRVMGLNNMGNALVACCRIPDGSDIEDNYQRYYPTRGSEVARTKQLRYHVLDTALQARCDNS